MGQHTMHETTSYDNIYMTTFTVVLLFISKMTMSDFAAAATILAALTTAGLNLYKFFKEKKRQE